MASADEGTYINTVQKLEVDLEAQFKIGLIKNVKYESTTKEFYILANKYGDDQILGFYMLRVSESDVFKSKFLIKFMNKLDIDDVDLYINYRGENSRELVIGYKSIYINVYHVKVMDITIESDQTLLFTHESF